MKDEKFKMIGHIRFLTFLFPKLNLFEMIDEIFIVNSTAINN